ncbi:gamma-butyrobetaine hydroxylase-like domain-containing protein [Massilia jejuensis]|uniref:Gamma-butyrobetaine hydroxylase-like domain-containing protein n=1 Tax=Massilia jejuensis TaxID=648894 RepID=A0ABW0PNF8_9BURK
MPIPTELTVHQKSRLLDIAFDDGSAFSIPFELLRVYSPSAEVKGHGPGQETLQVGKREVGIQGVEPVGNYAVKPVFTDGHDSGIFTWDYLYKLGSEQDALWQDYLNRLHAAGFEGDSGRQTGTVLPGALVRGGVCGSGHGH